MLLSGFVCQSAVPGLSATASRQIVLPQLTEELARGQSCGAAFGLARNRVHCGGGSRAAVWDSSATVLLLLVFRFKNSGIVHPELGEIFVLYPVTFVVIMNPSRPTLGARQDCCGHKSTII